MKRVGVQGSTKHRDLRRQVTRAIRHDRNDHWQRVVEDTERATAVGATRKLYQLVKQAGRDRTPSDATLLDRLGGIVTSLGEQLKRWEEFFMEHWNHETSVAIVDAASASNPAPPYGCSVTVPTKWELHSVIKRMKNHKSPGEDIMPPELFKGCSETLVPWLHRVIAMV